MINGGYMNQVIDLNYLESLNPCKERLYSFTNNYPKFSGTWSEFLDLENVTYNDKIWVARRFLNTNQLIHFAILCADSVSHIFNNKYPNDNRVNNLLNYLKEIKDFTRITEEQRTKIRELRYAADAAAAAAYAADADAADAAAAYAADAAAYAAAADAADADADAADAAYAADAAAAAAYARKSQQNLNITFLKAVEEL